MPPPNGMSGNDIGTPTINSLRNLSAAGSSRGLRGAFIPRFFAGVAVPYTDEKSRKITLRKR